MIGAYRPDMREADDAALQKSKLFVDSYDTTLGHIGELKIPLDSGAIDRSHLQADFYDMEAFRAGPGDITVFQKRWWRAFRPDDRALCFGPMDGRLGAVLLEQPGDARLRRV